jgi:hypothetical protein
MAAARARAFVVPVLTAESAAPAAAVAPAPETATAETARHHFHGDVMFEAMSMAVSVQSHFLSSMLHDGSKIYLYMLLARREWKFLRGCPLGPGAELANAKEAEPRIKSGVTGEEKENRLQHHCRHPGLDPGFGFSPARGLEARDASRAG